MFAVPQLQSHLASDHEGGETSPMNRLFRSESQTGQGQQHGQQAFNHFLRPFDLSVRTQNNEHMTGQ